ncbi:MAG: GNAT family acetyltransferase [Planctomycetes bacterium]|nr:GNAT family acetyltransferase [Planctomycetota bacterium]
MIIRRCEDADHDEIVALWDRVFPDPAPRNDPALNIALKRRTQPELLLVAVIDGRVAGTTMAGFDGHRGWLYLVVVDPGRRRHGVGTALVRRAEELLAERGCLKVNLQVLATNAEVVAFYEHLGYAVEERVSMGKQLVP